MQIDLTEREEYKSSELDYWCALFFGVLFGNESIDSFNLHKFSKVILKNRKDSYDKIVEKRWEALEAYFSNNSEKCLNCLNEAKKIAGNSDGWIQNDIDLDIRNVYRYQAHTLSDILLLGKKSSSAEDNNISEETYYPGIDRITNNLNEKFFSESVSDRLDYGLSFTISNELVGCAQQLASILAIAMYYGSLSHLLLMFRYVKYFMAYLSFKYDNFQFRYSYLKLAIWDNNKDDIDGILREFPDLYNKLSNDSVKEVIDLSKNHHEVYHELKSKMLAFKYLGYYLSDSNFIKVFNDLDLCVRNLYTDDYEGALLVNEWLNCLPHVRHRLSFVEFCNPLFYYIESNKTLNFSEVLLFVWNHVNIEELSSKKQKKLIEYFKMHLNEKHLGNIQRSGKLLTFFRIEYGEKFSFLDDVFRKLKDTLEELYLSYFAELEAANTDNCLFYLIKRLHSELNEKHDGLHINGNQYLSRIDILLDDKSELSAEIVRALYEVSILSIKATFKSNQEKIIAISIILRLLALYPQVIENLHSEYITWDDDKYTSEFNLMDDPMFGTSKDIVLIGLYLLTYWGNKNALINVIRLLQNIQKNETFLLYVMHPLKKFYESLTNKNDKRNFLVTLYPYLIQWISLKDTRIQTSAIFFLLELGEFSEYSSVVISYMERLLETGSINTKNYILRNLKKLNYITNEEYIDKLLKYKDHNNYVVRLVCNELLEGCF